MCVRQSVSNLWRVISLFVIVAVVALWRVCHFVALAKISILFNVKQLPMK